MLLNRLFNICFHDFTKNATGSRQLGELVKWGVYLSSRVLITIMKIIKVYYFIFNLTTWKTVYIERQMLMFDHIVKLSNDVPTYRILTLPSGWGPYRRVETDWSYPRVISKPTRIWVKTWKNICHDSASSLK